MHLAWSMEMRISRLASSTLNQRSVHFNTPIRNPFKTHKPLTSFCIEDKISSHNNNGFHQTHNYTNNEFEECENKVCKMKPAHVNCSLDLVTLTLVLCRSFWMPLSRTLASSCASVRGGLRNGGCMSIAWGLRHRPMYLWERRTHMFHC